MPDARAGTRPAPARGSSIRTPSASSTSALPTLPDTARLPCFATGTPAAATTSAAAVETLKVCDAVAAGAAGVDGVRRARRGSTVPSARSARAAPDQLVDASRPSAAGRAESRRSAPASRRPRGSPPSRPSCSASSRSRPSARRAMASRSASWLMTPAAPGSMARKFRRSCLPSSVRIDSGWNCTPSTQGRAVAHAHDLALDRSTAARSSSAGKRRGIDHQRVVARGVERVGQPGEDAAPVVVDGRRLAVHDARRAHDVGRRSAAPIA